MKKQYILLLFTVVLLSACTSWLLEDSPGTSGIEEFFKSSGEVAIQATNACYTPLMWENAADRTFICDWFIGDVVSDDALKGGEAVEDQPDVYYMENLSIEDTHILDLDFLKIERWNVEKNCVCF
jgi:hypothetical protein